jgi:hypothetical protein
MVNVIRENDSEVGVNPSFQLRRYSILGYVLCWYLRLVRLIISYCSGACTGMGPMVKVCYSKLDLCVTVHHHCR